MQPGFQTSFTFYNFDDEGEREVTSLCACSAPGSMIP